MSSHYSPWRLLVLLLALLGLSGCAVIMGGRPMGRFEARTSEPAPSAPAAHAVRESGDSNTSPVTLPGVVAGHKNTASLTANKLQSELLAFVGRYQDAIAEASDWGASHAASASSRAGFVQLKVVYVTGAITTATESEPLRVLRDLLVMVRLQRMARLLAQEKGDRQSEQEARKRERREKERRSPNKDRRRSRSRDRERRDRDRRDRR